MSIYDPGDEKLIALGAFLNGVGLTGVPDGPLELIDLELSNDGQRLLMLLQTQASSESRQFAASIDVDELDRGWQHPWNRYDVNNDGTVSPLDALHVINRLARNPDNTLAGSASPDGPFYDVDGNDRATPLDALLVINQLSRSVANGR